MSGRSVLLGAGASAEAGIPTVREMSRRLLAALPEWDNSRALLAFVMGGLMFRAGARGEDPNAGVDVEELFTAVEALASRDTVEMAPFVAGWHPMVERVERMGRSRRPPEGRLSEGLKKAITGVVADAVGGHHISDTAIRQFARDLVEVIDPGSRSAFASLSQEMVQALRGILNIPDVAAVSYLKPLIELSRSQGALSIASLNYDRSVEIIGQEMGLSIATGIEAWATEGHLDFPEAAIKLLKLHGSIDWVEEDRWPEPSEQKLPVPVVRPMVSADVNAAKPAVIFGGGNKLRADGPYLDLLRTFGDELVGIGQLVIVGYSFRDDHVNTVIRTWFNTNETRTIVVVNPSFAQLPSLFAQQLRQFAGARITVIPKGAKEGLPLALGV